MNYTARRSMRSGMGGKANTLHSDGVTALPKEGLGAFDQRSVERRDDVIVFPSPEFKEPVEATGPVPMPSSCGDANLRWRWWTRFVSDGTACPAGYARSKTSKELPSSSPAW